jgi:hypothetical protein
VDVIWETEPVCSFKKKVAIDYEIDKRNCVKVLLSAVVVVVVVVEVR